MRYVISVFIVAFFGGMGMLLVHAKKDKKVFFSKNKTRYSSYRVVTNPIDLKEIAKDMLYYLEHNPKARLSLKDPDYFRSYITLDQAKETLRFVIETIRQDEGSGKFRICDPLFLQKHFGTVRWLADRETAKKKHNKILPKNGKIRLTSYVFFKVKGSRKKTSTFNQALYELKDESCAKKYTREDVFNGVFEETKNKHRVRPLVWLRQRDVEEAIMQGSVVVQFSDGSSDLYHIHLDNGYAYNRSKDKYDQKRYWYFRPVSNTFWFFRKEGGKTGNWISRVNRRKGVVFAGDVYDIGFGKLIALFDTTTKQMRLGILADTGGAFKDNLYQLDLFGGCVHPSKLKVHLKTIPRFAHACILYKKRGR